MKQSINLLTNSILACFIIHIINNEDTTENINGEEAETDEDEDDTKTSQIKVSIFRYQPYDDEWWTMNKQFPLK